MTKYHDIELMQHADGELSERDKRDLDVRIEGDADAGIKIEAIHELGEVARGHLELSADAVPDARFAAMWSSIDGALGDPPPVASSSTWRRIGNWLDRYRGYLLTGALSAGAVATLALVLRGGGDEMGSSGAGAIKVQPVNLRTPPQIESLDTPGGAGSVLNIEDEDGHATVIWVTPQDTVEGI